MDGQPLPPHHPQAAATAKGGHRHTGRMNRAISSATLLKGARLAAAFALTAGAFIATRQLFHGWCLFPRSPWHATPWGYPQIERVFFYLLPIVFLLGFLWLVWEFVYPILAAAGIRKTGARLLAIGLALAIYAGVGYVGWMTTPEDTYKYIDRGGGPTAKVVWAFWDIGLLLRTGNFSTHGCGY